MPTPISHGAVGFAIGAWAPRDLSARRLYIVAAACAMLPDIDVVGFPLHVARDSLFAHRAITHSIAFAIVGAVVATAVFFRSDQWRERRGRIAVILGLALLSHSCLDALSTYSRGVEFLAPFSQHRFRFVWTPLGDPRPAGRFLKEAIVVLLPAILIAWLGRRRQRGA